MREQSTRKKVLFPIGLKLNLIFGTLLLIALVLVSFFTTYLVSQDVRVNAEDNNLSINTRAAAAVTNEFSSIQNTCLQFLDIYASQSNNKMAQEEISQLFFERNKDILSLLVLSEESSTPYIRIENIRYFLENELDIQDMDLFVSQSSDTLAKTVNGEVCLSNASPAFSSPILALFFPYENNLLSYVAVALFSADRVANVLGAGRINTTFVVNGNNELLFHPDSELMNSAQSMTNYPLMEILKERGLLGETSGIQIPFFTKDESQKDVQYFGAFQKLPLVDASVITTVSLDTVLEGVRSTQKNNLYLTLIILFVSIIAILFFARFAIARHLRKLVACQEEIQNGNFETSLISTLNSHRSDEIGVLNQSTKDEQEFLSIFSRFTNKNVARAIARKEIDFEPHLKDVTIFFSDIRGFTAISDAFKNRFGDESPKHIIGFLNDYMERMVSCVTASGGTIDKFEGDAIMAVWGILRDSDLSFESLPDSNPKKIEAKKNHESQVRQDALNAIKGTIAMRYVLMEYNKDAAAFTKMQEGKANASYKPQIKIGCGINTGRATCGIMGSIDKMEYTAIGDSVNFASRTEASNKACGTDILISQDTYNVLKQDYIRCSENNFTLSSENEKDEIIVEMIPVEFEVKGKGSQHFYGVVNMPQFNIEEFFRITDKDFKVDFDCARSVGPRGPKTLKDVRNLLGIPTPEFENLNLGQDENKVQIKQ